MCAAAAANEPGIAGLRPHAAPRFKCLRERSRRIASIIDVELEMAGTNDRQRHGLRADREMHEGALRLNVH
jgi:hypothetical protein